MQARLPVKIIRQNEVVGIFISASTININDNRNYNLHLNVVIPMFLCWRGPRSLYSQNKNTD